ncbi:hypothetical protein [Lysobacter zhanggongensis]|uniref:hypothetical protein n=1 Tax=Lysobacter zhanggongensis TaxID=1774951 RepID=UPI00399CB692
MNRPATRPGGAEALRPGSAGRLAGPPGPGANLTPAWQQRRGDGAPPPEELQAERPEE